MPLLKKFKAVEGTDVPTQRGRAKSRSGLTNTIKSNKPPIILIPGILDAELGMVELANELYERFGEAHPISIYGNEELLAELAEENADPVFETDLAKPTPLSLDQQSELIAKEIQASSSLGPYIIVGYSYGCAEAIATAEHLAKQGLDSFLYLIDGTTPESSREYFMDNPESATVDLIRIIQAAAEMHDFKYKRAYSSLEIAALIKLSNAERIEKIAKLMIAAQSNLEKENRDRFKAQVEIISQNLDRLLSHTSVPFLAKDSKECGKITIHNLTIDATAKKYTANKKEMSSTFQGGWDLYPYPFTAVPAKHVETLEHTSLMTDETAIQHHVAAISDIIQATQKEEYVNSYRLKMVNKKLTALSVELEELCNGRAPSEIMDAIGLLSAASAKYNSENSPHQSKSPEIQVSAPITIQSSVPTTSHKSSYVSEEDSGLASRSTSSGISSTGFFGSQPQSGVITPQLHEFAEGMGPKA